MHHGREHTQLDATGSGAAAGATGVDPTVALLRSTHLMTSSTTIRVAASARQMHHCPNVSDVVPKIRWSVLCPQSSRLRVRLKEPQLC